MNKGKRTRERSHTISGLPSETLGMFLQVGNECHLYMRGHTRNTHQGCSVKKVFLEISQNSQENTYARAFFLIKLQALGLRPATLLKKRLAQVFSYESCDISNSTFCYRTSPVAVSVIQSLLVYL